MNQNGVYRLGAGISAPFTATATRFGPFSSTFITTLRIASTSACHFKVGDSMVVATAADALLPANTKEYVNIAGGQYISIIADSAAGTAQLT